jgi:hypothetical protein
MPFPTFTRSAVTWSGHGYRAKFRDVGGDVSAWPPELAACRLGPGLGAYRLTALLGSGAEGQALPAQTLRLLVLFFRTPP